MVSKIKNNSALIVIDFINDIVNADGKLGSCAQYLESHPVIQNTNLLIKIYREYGLPIFFVRLAFKPDYSNLPADWSSVKVSGALKDGTWGTEIDSRLDFNATCDRVITKERVSPFHNTTLESDLRQLSVTAVVVTGVATNNAPDLFARESWDKGFGVTIITDACGASDDQHQEAALIALPPMIKQQTTQGLI